MHVVDDGLEDARGRHRPREIRRDLAREGELNRSARNNLKRNEGSWRCLPPSAEVRPLIVTFGMASIESRCMGA